MEPCKFIAPLLYLILIFSFAKAQNDCPLFNETFLGSADELTSTGLIADAFRATSGDPTQILVQVHAAHIVCLRSGQTRDRFSGISIIVNYTCTGPPPECTGSPTLSQFEFECSIGTTWSASVDGSASDIITTPPDGSFSTPRRSDCGVCISPMRASFGGTTNNTQHCGSCNPACSSSGLMRCFNRLPGGCCNYYENDMCVIDCTFPRVPDVNFDCVIMNNTCHDAIGCGGSMVTGVNTAEECCLGSGLSFRNGSGVCRQCIVHGFVRTTDLELNEGATQEVFTMILDVKGNTISEPASTRVINFGFQFTCIDSSNGGGPQAVDRSDYSDTGCGSNIQLRLFPSAQRRSEVGISAVADDKIEGNEDLILQLVLSSATQTAINNAGNIFFQDTLNIRVVDVTVVVIGFSEDDYTADEGDDGARPNAPCSVVVELIQTRLEIPLQVQLTPTARDATARDFNDTVIETEIPAGQTLLMQPIQIFDDEINEARENFEVALEIVTNISNVVMYRRRTTLCRIRQSDPIEIGFTRRRIFHTEALFGQFDTLINKSRASEQTFVVQIEIGTLTSPFGQSATQGQDFAAGIGNVVLRQLTPNENNISFSYRIIEDNTPENQEVFQLSVTPAIGSPAFTCTEANGCFQQLEVVIVDDDVVVVGFVDTLVEVNETDGQATVNVSISSPAPNAILEFEIMFSLRVDSIDGSAGSQSVSDSLRNPIPGDEDFPQIVDSMYYTFQEMPFNILEFRVLNQMFNDTQRSQTFTFPIFVDDVPEGVEGLQLNLSLREDPTLPPRSVNVTPAVATVRIHDFSSVVVGFERRIYTVGEADGQVELCVNITVPRRQDIGTVTFNLSVETQDGSAVSPDDYTGVSMILGPFTTERPRQCFNISITDDASLQPTRNFTARLTLLPASVTTISANRIIVDPPEVTVQITDSPTTPPPTTPPLTTPPLTTPPPTTPPPSIRVNDTVTGDPLMTVPLNVGNDTRMLLGLDENERVSLCYEVHGEANENFNLVSDMCVSVNAHYARVRSDVDINVIDQIGVRAVDNANQCHNIAVDLNGCSAFVDGVEITTSYRMGGISVRKYPTRVRIAVPNCDDHDLVMWVFCQTGTFPNGNMTFDAPMIRYVIAHGFNLAETSHGILGQFWNIPINMVRYNEQIRGDVRTDAYNITVNYPGQQRQFVGFLYSLNWELEENWCLYVGNRQGGPISEVDNPNDPVLQGEYSDYKVDNIFGTEYAFDHFESARCMA